MREASGRTIVHSEGAPAAIGPYSQAVRMGETIYCSGQIGLDPVAGKLVAGGVEAETRQVLANLEAVLEAAGAGLSDVVRTTIYLRDMADFGRVNEVYGVSFSDLPPARATVAVKELPLGAAVEIDAIAVLG